jgi:4-azaleucine resistance transporter AzlC
MRWPSTDPALGRPARGQSFRAGAIATLPLMVGIIPFALLLGALGAQKGLSPLEMTLMSVLVFAGSAQFLAVELWREPAPVLLLTGMALLVNSRHVLMGAAIAPRFAGVAASRLYPALYVLTDEAWAVTLASPYSGAAAFSFYLGVSLSLWLGWVFWTTAGALAGAVVQDPATFGLDFAFIAVFLVLLRGMWRGPRSLVPWFASAGAAILVERLVPGPLYVPAGAGAGLLVAALMTRRVVAP